MACEGLSVDTGNPYSHGDMVALRYEQHNLSVRIINLKLQSSISVNLFSSPEYPHIS